MSFADFRLAAHFRHGISGLIQVQYYLRVHRLICVFINYTNLVYSMIFNIK